LVGCQVSDIPGRQIGCDGHGVCWLNCRAIEKRSIFLIVIKKIIYI
jgi:hypothetical protein